MQDVVEEEGAPAILAASQPHYGLVGGQGHGMPMHGAAGGPFLLQPSPALPVPFLSGDQQPLHGAAAGQGRPTPGGVPALPLTSGCPDRDSGSRGGCCRVAVD